MSLDLEAIKFKAAKSVDSSSAWARESSAWAREYSRDVPALVAEVERLRTYAKHSHKCRMQPWFDGDLGCTCGLGDAL